ncbi:MAG: chorismate mutase [Acidobacteria bacterium]|nr:chorismate mutase [Acidobacteriota bacterium]
MDISDWRRKIDDIDRRLVRLLNERAQCVLEIGKIKHQQGLPITESRREDEVLRHAVEVSHGPMDGDAIRRVFEGILRESRDVQEKLFEQTDRNPAKKTEQQT